MADIAVKGKLERRSGQPHLKAGAVPVERGDEIGEADGGIDRLVVPRETPGGSEAARDRRPGQRQLDIVERLDDLVGLVAQDDRAVLDPDLGERRGPSGAGLEM